MAFYIVEETEDGRIAQKSLADQDGFLMSMLEAEN
jgi:hypothetical protein